MSCLRITLFGKFDARLEEQSATGLEAAKTQELLAYLLMNRERPHYRDKLASVLWQNSSSAQSKAYLRQILWQIQSALGQDNRLLGFEAEWIGVNSDADLWVDVHCFEHAWSQSAGINGRDLDPQQAGALQEGVSLYRADLLENWYQEWCLFERERLQNMYLAMLEKLISYCEVNRHYEMGIGYAAQILRCDTAHERTYRRLMRLHHLNGNRTVALRTYKRCVTALDEELGVKPAQNTIRLYEQIRADQFGSSSPKVQGGTESSVRLQCRDGNFKLYPFLVSPSGHRRNESN
jgi:DNA-binding SARP family transcriptional activator